MKQWIARNHRRIFLNLLMLAGFYAAAYAILTHVTIFGPRWEGRLGPFYVSVHVNTEWQQAAIEPFYHLLGPSEGLTDDELRARGVKIIKSR